MSALFVDPTTKECTDDARAAVRLGFHDAASWSKKASALGDDRGGADGSFLLFREDARPENNGLQDFVGKLVDIHSRNPGVSAADIVQFAAHHGTVSCPQGPRIIFFAGRKDATEAAPPGLVPDVHDSSQNLISLMMDKTINAQDLTSLLGAHTSAKRMQPFPLSPFSRSYSWWSGAIFILTRCSRLPIQLKNKRLIFYRIPCRRVSNRCSTRLNTWNLGYQLLQRDSANHRRSRCLSISIRSCTLPVPEHECHLERICWTTTILEPGKNTLCTYQTGFILTRSGIRTRIHSSRSPGC